MSSAFRSHNMYILILFASVFLFTSTFALEPANPNTNSKAKAILNFLASQNDKKEKKLVSGQFLEFEGNVSTKLLTDTYDKTGKWPALTGADWSTWGNIKYTKSNEALKWAWKQGCLVTVSVHMQNPVSGKWEKTPVVDLKTLLKSGTDVYRRWFAELDTMAAGLEDLQKAGVVVLFRPLHEMNGDWFWWGRKKQEDYINVWKQIFDYFTNTKKLNNLLWVFGPNHGNSPASYYPGDKYCDIVGLDAYTSDISLNGIKGYPEMAAISKPFGLTEYGPVSATDPKTGVFDYRVLITNLKKDMPKMCFFLAWSGPWAIIQNKYAREALNDPYVANRDDITDAFKPLIITTPVPVHTTLGNNKTNVLYLTGFCLDRKNRFSAPSSCIFIDHGVNIFDISGKKAHVIVNPKVHGK